MKPAPRGEDRGHCRVVGIARIVSVLMSSFWVRSASRRGCTPTAAVYGRVCEITHVERATYINSVAEVLDRTARLARAPRSTAEKTRAPLTVAERARVLRHNRVLGACVPRRGTSQHVGVETTGFFKLLVLPSPTPFTREARTGIALC